MFDLHGRPSVYYSILTIRPRDGKRVVSHTPAKGDTNPLERLRRRDLENQRERRLAGLGKGEAKGDVLKGGVGDEATSKIVTVFSIVLGKG